MAALFLLVLITLPFGAKFLIYQFTPGFHEYEAAFVYASDIALVLFLAVYAVQVLKKFYGGKPEILNPKSETNSKYQISKFSAQGGSASGGKTTIQNAKITSLTVFLLAAFASAFYAPSLGLAIYSFVRPLLLVGFAFAAAKILSDQKIFQRALAVLAALAVLQSLIGVWQFKAQDDLGLQFLGESPIGAFDSGTSKVVLDGTKFVRAYGTFPHPNMLAAFLIVGLVALFYFWLKRPSERKLFSGWRTALSDAILGVGIFLVSIGLVFAFSRTGWAIALAVTGLIIIYGIVKRNYFVQGVRLAILSAAIFGILVFNFGDYIFPRAQISPTEPAVTQRLQYNKLALELIKEKPFGVGIGNQILYSVKSGLYQKLGMDESWQWQPIHNFYLLVASEVGVLGLVSFIIFISFLFWQAGKNYYPDHNNDHDNLMKIIVIVILSLLLLLGLTDHFLWTLPQGQLMLWLAVGFVLGLTPRNTLYYNDSI